MVVHQLTSIPRAIDPRRYEEQFRENDRLWREGTRNLVRAALAAGARRVMAQSVAFAYRPEGSLVKDERAPLFLDAPPPYSRSTLALRDLEDAVLETEGIEGIVLRYGYVYGPGTAYASDGHTAALVRKGRMPIVGRGTGVFSFVHVDDAAAATVVAIEAAATVVAIEAAAPGVYNIVDDDPAPVREWLPRYAEALGARRPRRVPRWLARLAAGPGAVLVMTQQRGASNARARRELGWEPRYPTWRAGFREALG